MVRGSAAAADLACGGLSALVGRVVTRRHAVERCLGRYMLREDTRAAIEDMAGRRNVVVRYDEGKEGSEDDGEGVETALQAAGNCNYCLYILI